MKVHAKACVIKKKVGTRSKKYGFVSTGNLNEKTAKVYSDFCLLTSNASIMADVERIFQYLEKPKENEKLIDECTQLLTCPKNLRTKINELIEFEIKQAKKGKHAEMILKMNSLSDEILIEQLYEAAKHGVKIKLIVRGIFCMMTDLPKLKHHLHAISIVDEYLEHARVFMFHHAGDEKIFISSADWMVRNLNHRVEATCPINNASLKKELKEILHLQLMDNVKARTLDNKLSNIYKTDNNKKKIRSQVEIMKYLAGKN
jgi:polyphosphate kinase